MYLFLLLDIVDGFENIFFKFEEFCRNLEFGEGLDIIDLGYLNDICKERIWFIDDEEVVVFEDIFF